MVTSGRLQGRRAVVTGASRGIGAGIAERLAAEGADVAIVARTLDRHDHLRGSLRQTEQRMQRFGGRVATIVADITDDEERARIIPEAVSALGGSVDILVNNAAAAIFMPIVGFPLNRRRILFEANVHAPLDFASIVTQSMREVGSGWIVNLTSSGARLWEGPPFDLNAQGTTITAYGASKAALNKLTNGLAAELYGTGIRVNAVQPRAAVLSEGSEQLVGGTLRPDQIESMEEMVEAVLFLCDCPEDVTGRICVSLDVIAEQGLVVHNVDGTPRVKASS